MPDVPTLFIIEDDDLMRDLVRALIASTGPSVEAFASAQEFLDELDEARPGCVVSDLRLPGMGGLQLQQHLAARRCPLPLILLSGHGDIPSAVAALKSGALDFLEKPFRAQALLDEVQTALRRNAELRRRQTERDAARARFAGLSQREREVLDLIVAGHPNKVAAVRLGSARTRWKSTAPRSCERPERTTSGS